MLRFGSLFSGVGGADMGLVAAGMVPAWACEIDRQARAVYRRHFPGVPIHLDIKELRGASLEPVDLLFFGSPCQDLSQAGGRAGLAGERSGLFHEAMRIVDEMAAPPRIAIWENVRGALSSNGGDDFAAVLTEMGRRWSGVAYRILDLQYFGPPQRRERVFVVGHSGGWRRAAEVLFEPEGVRWNPPARRKAGQTAAGTIEASACRSCGAGTPVSALTTHALVGHAEYGAQPPALRAKGGDYGGGSEALVAFGGANTVGPVDVAARLGCNESGSGYRIDFESDTLVMSPPAPDYPLWRCPDCGEIFRDEHAVIGSEIAPPECSLCGGERASIACLPDVAHTLRGEGALASEDGTGRGTPLVLAFQERFRGDDGRGYDRAPAVREESTGALETVKPWCVAQSVALRGRDGGGAAELSGDTATALRASRGGGDKPHVLVPVAFPARLSGTQCARAQDRSPALGSLNPMAVACRSAVRRLTPRECHRLMGWPDDWCAWGVDDAGKIIKMADGPQYKMIGNGVGKPHAEWLARRVLAVEAEPENYGYPAAREEICR